jgi:hypothetical protein
MKEMKFLQHHKDEREKPENLVTKKVLLPHSPLPLEKNFL